MSTFSIKASPGTDIWRKPPSKDDFNAPTSTPAGAKTTAKLGAFRSATVSFAFAPTELYDQGGVVLSLNPPNSSTGSTPAKWIKTGIELYNGQPVLGTVACDSWADWSLSPVPDTSIFTAAAADKKGFTTLTLDRGTDENGVSLWIHQVTESGEKLALREICWVFEEGLRDWEVSVAAYAARPSVKTDKELEVEFRTLDVQWNA